MTSILIREALFPGSFLGGGYKKISLTNYHQKINNR